MFTIAVVDDEQKHIDNIKNYLSEFFAEERNGERFTVVEFRDGNELLNEYEPKYDLIFLDIEMNESNGMDTARKIREKDGKTAVIFITRLANYALKGYEVDALDFIVKPIEYEQFAFKLKKALKRIESNRDKLIKIDLPGGEFRWLSASSIRYAEIQNHSLILHLEDDVVIKAWTSLKSIAQELESNGFAYCHRCYLVNLRFVTSVTKNSCFLGDEELMVSRYKKAEFISELARFYGRGGGGINDLFRYIFQNTVYSIADNSDARLLYIPSEAKVFRPSPYRNVRRRYYGFNVAMGFCQVGSRAKRRRDVRHNIM